MKKLSKITEQKQTVDKCYNFISILFAQNSSIRKANIQKNGELWIECAFGFFLDTDLQNILKKQSKVSNRENKLNFTE